MKVKLGSQFIVNIIPQLLRYLGIYLRVIIYIQASEYVLLKAPLISYIAIDGHRINLDIWLFLGRRGSVIGLKHFICVSMTEYSDLPLD
jgi:hypothetical protein